MPGEDHLSPGAPASTGVSLVLPPEEEALVAALEAKLGLPLPDRLTALAALTHKSYVNEARGGPTTDNERLEFLGDAVIDLAVSHRLMERFPAAREGDLSKMRAAVVDEQGLAALSRALDLGALLRLGRGEERTGGRKRPSLLADAMEAVVAAVYLTAGLPGVLALVDRLLPDAFQRAASGTLDRDFKTQLQELAQRRLQAVPRYQVVAAQGPDHAKVFEVALDLKGEELSRATGRSKKDAEQAAARVGLEVLLRKLAEGVFSAPTATSTPTEISTVAEPPLPSGERAGERGAVPAPPPPTPTEPPAVEESPLPSGERAGERGAVTEVVPEPAPRRPARVRKKVQAVSAKKKAPAKAKRPASARRPSKGR